MKRMKEWQSKSDLHNDVVDWDVNKLDKEANEAHDGKSDCCGKGYFLKFYYKIERFLNEFLRALLLHFSL